MPICVLFKTSKIILLYYELKEVIVLDIHVYCVIKTNKINTIIHSYIWYFYKQLFQFTIS